MHAEERARLDALDAAHVWHPYTRFSALRAGPLPMIVRGEGCHLFDADGRRYVDAVASWWAASLGHSHPAIVEAIRRQAGQLQHSILGNLAHPGATRVAAALSRAFPPSSRRVLFASDGASAVEVALRVAAQYQAQVGQPTRTRFLALRHGYHGDTLGAVAIGYLESFHAQLRPLLQPALQVDPPCEGARHRGYAPTELPSDAFDPLDALLEREGARIAACIVEPLCQCASGMRMYPEAYLQGLAQRCRERGILLIADEIATGFWRTGRAFACEHAGVDADIVCVGKALAAGALPLSAAIVREDVARTFDDEPEDHTLYHGHTFAGNPLACAAAEAALAEYARPAFQQHVAQAADILREGLRALRHAPGIAAVRCLGLIGAAECAHPDLAAAARDRLFAAGILVRPLGNVLYLMPPLVMPLDLLGDTVERFAAALRTTAG